jgi:hypothetical protein
MGVLHCNLPSDVGCDAVIKLFGPVGCHGHGKQPGISWPTKRLLLNENSDPRSYSCKKLSKIVYWNSDKSFSFKIRFGSCQWSITLLRTGKGVFWAIFLSVFRWRDRSVFIQLNKYVRHNWFPPLEDQSLSTVNTECFKMRWQIFKCTFCRTLLAISACAL